MLSTRTRIFFVACLKDAAGDALKKAATDLGFNRPKNGGSSSATLHTNVPDLDDGFGDQCCGASPFLTGSGCYKKVGFQPLTFF